MRIASVTALLLALAVVPLAGHAKTPAAHAKTERKPPLAEMAARGDGDAQYQLGLAAMKSRRHDVGQALVWFSLAAANGSAPAAVEAAKLYEQQGANVPAARWWYQAGVLGDTAARARFLDRFMAGDAGSLGGMEGAAWLGERADAGDPRAAVALGDAFERGLGVPVDPARAEHAFAGAALDGDAEAMYRLGRLQLHTPAVWRIPAKETDSKGRWQGPMMWLLRPGPDLGAAAVAAENEVAPSALSFFRPGMVSGERWLERAAELGLGDAQYTLGMAYLAGVDLPPDVLSAARWLQAAAWQGHTGAMVAVAGLAAAGQGFPGKDPVRAWVCYDLAAAQGDKGAEEARDRLSKSLTGRQMTRARQIAQESRDFGER